MIKNEKKVIVFIVEGMSEEAALGTIMKEFFINEEVQFFIVHGDITLHDYVSVDKILLKINKVLDTVKERYRYKTSDFLKIIHITDTDGVFISDDKVTKAKVPEITYYEDCVVAPSVSSTLERNHRKADILFKLRNTGKVKKIPYRIYFNSCNLEHVLFNELKDFSDEEKEEMSDAFADRYEGRCEEFIDFISSENLAVVGSYQDTWDFIEEGMNSLQRHSNMHQIFGQDLE